MPHKHSINNPCKAQKSARDEREQVHDRIHSVDQSVVRHASKLQELAGVQEYRIDLREQGDHIERKATALDDIEEKRSSNLLKY